MGRGIRLIIGMALLGMELTAVSWAGDPRAEKLYGNGVHAFYGGNYAQAIRDFDRATAYDSQDPRVFYFRGVAKRRMGRTYEGRSDLQYGAQLEASQGRTDIGRSLQRLQGHDRVLLEQYRRQAQRMAALAPRVVEPTTPSADGPSETAPQRPARSQMGRQNRKSPGGRFPRFPSACKTCRTTRTIRSSIRRPGYWAGARSNRRSRRRRPICPRLWPEMIRRRSPVKQPTTCSRVMTRWSIPAGRPKTRSPMTARCSATRVRAKRPVRRPTRPVPNAVLSGPSFAPHPRRRRGQPRAPTGARTAGRRSQCAAGRCPGSRASVRPAGGSFGSGGSVLSRRPSAPAPAADGTADPGMTEPADPEDPFAEDFAPAEAEPDLFADPVEPEATEENPVPADEFDPFADDVEDPFAEEVAP